MSPVVSVIVPAYNAEQYIYDCAKRILIQSFSNIELLMVDDGSTDNTLKICREIAGGDSRVRVLHQENAGVSVARNTALLHATGDYVAFIDSDDLVAEDYLEYLLQGIKSKQCILSMCSHERIYNYDYEFTEARERFTIFPAQDCAKRLLTGRFPISAWGCLFKRSLVDGIQFNAGIRNNEDKLFLYQYLLSNETGLVGFSNSKLYGYYVRDGSASRCTWDGSMDIIYVADQIKKDTKKSHPEWNEITQNVCIGARFDVMKSIVRSQKTVHGDRTYDELRREVMIYGWPKNGDHRLKAEYLAARIGKPAYKALVNTYYKLYSDEKRFKLNEKRTKQ